MISVYNIKPRFQEVLTPVLKMLHNCKVSANQITIASLGLSVVIGILFWNASLTPWLYLALPAGLLIRMALNALDGMMARKYNQQSKLGEVLNEIGDVISDVFIFLPLIKYQPNALYLVILFIVLAIINEFAGVLTKIISGNRRYDGPMGKSDRALILGIYGVLAFLCVDISHLLPYVFVVIIGLLILSTITRLKKSLA